MIMSGITLENSDGNFVEIVNNDKFSVSTRIYESEQAFKRGEDPLFSRVKYYTFYLGKELEDLFEEQKGHGNRKVSSSINGACMMAIEAAAIKDPDRFRVPVDTPNGIVYLKGDWEVKGN
jgi:hypothetical protein